MTGRKKLHVTAFYICIFVSNTPSTLFAVDSPRSEYPNLAYLRPSAQGPGEHTGLVSSLAVDGQHDTHYNNCAHTNYDPINWWLVDLGDLSIIYGVAILNRDKSQERLSNYTIDVFGDDPREILTDFPEGYGEICTHQENNIAAAEWGVIDCEHPLIGRFLRLVKYGFEALTICEIEVFGRKLLSTKIYSKRSSGLTSSGDPKLLGHFKSAIQCASALVSEPEFQNFDFDAQTGSCTGTHADKSTW